MNKTINESKLFAWIPWILTVLVIIFFISIKGKI